MSTNLNYKKEYTNSWALIIGINQYQHLTPLWHAKNDAEDLAKLLESTFDFKKENIFLLIDGEATQEAIREVFHEFTKISKVDPNDRLLIFFAGHGHTAKGNRGEVGFLMPVDGDAEDVNTLIRWDELTRGADLIPAKHIFFIMDACYGGLAFLRAPSFGSARFLGDMLQRYTRQALTSGKADEAVADGNGPRPGHSIFTGHLLNALEGGAAREDGTLTANGVMAYVHDRVARDQYSDQTPHFGFIEGEGDFIFNTLAIDKKQAEHEKDTEGRATEGETGDDDILVKTSPQIVNLETISDPIKNKMEELLSEPKDRIKLANFVHSNVKAFLDATDLRHFPLQDSNVQKEDLVERLHLYEKCTKNLLHIAMLLARWGNQEQMQLLETILQDIAEADKGSTGVSLWLELTWYPTQLIMFAAGISALYAKNYSALTVIFETKIRDRDNRGDIIPITILIGNHCSAVNEKFKLLPDHEKQYVPRSEYLYKTLQPILEDTFFLGKRYEDLFDQFEILLAIEYAHLDGRDWGPIGRFGWKHKRHYGQSPFTLLVADATEKGSNWELTRAGLFNGSFDHFLAAANAFKSTLDRLSWF
jgi:hypothetical protein